MGQLIKFSPGQIHVKMLGTLCRSRDEGKVDVCGRCGRKLLLCLLSRFLKSLKSHLVSGQIHAFRPLEFINHPLCQLVIKIISAKAGISVGCENLNDTVPDLNDGNVKSTAAKVIYHDLLLFFIVKSVSESRSRGLVDNTLHIKARDLARILGCLTLCVVEVSGNRDNSLRHLFSQIALGIRFQLLKNHSRNLLRGIFLSVNVAAPVRTHVSLDGCDGLLRICHCLTLCRLADQSLSGLGKRNHRGSCSGSFRIGNNGGLTAFHNRHAAVCRT